MRLDEVGVPGALNGILVAPCQCMGQDRVRGATLERAAPLMRMPEETVCRLFASAVWFLFSIFNVLTADRLFLTTIDILIHSLVVPVLPCGIDSFDTFPV